MDISSFEEFNGLLLSLYRGSRELPLGQFEEAALAMIKSVLGFDSAIWGSGIMTASGVSRFGSHLHNEPPDVLAAYEAIKHQDSAVQMLRESAGGVLAYNSATMFCGKSKTGVRDYTRRYAHENCLVCVAVDDTSAAHCLGLYRAKAGREYTERERILTQMLLPHLIETLKTNRLSHLEHLKAGDSSQFLYAAIADAQGAIHHADVEFMALLRDEFREPIARRMPAAVLGALLETGRFAGHGMVIQVTKERHLLFLKARCRCAADGLSTREWQIARKVVQGMNYKEIAESLFLAPSTVRNHIQNIHHKLNTHNALELIAQLNLAS